MKWSEFLARFGDQPVLETGMLLGGGESPAEVQRQLSRWTRSGRLIQHRALFFGYEEQRAGGGPRFLVATPEKALLDLIHLTPGRVTEEYVRELRLETDLDVDRLAAFAERTGKPKLKHAARLVRRLLRPERTAR